MAKGPIRRRAHARRRDELCPEPGPFPRSTARTPGTLRRASGADPRGPRRARERWARLEAKALDVADTGSTGPSTTPTTTAPSSPRRIACGIPKGRAADAGGRRDAPRDDRRAGGPAGVIRFRWADAGSCGIPSSSMGRSNEKTNTWNPSWMARTTTRMAARLPAHRLRLAATAGGAARARGVCSGSTTAIQRFGGPRTQMFNLTRCPSTASTRARARRRGRSFTASRPRPIRTSRCSWHASSAGCGGS